MDDLLCIYCHQDDSNGSAETRFVLVRATKLHDQNRQIHVILEHKLHWIICQIHVNQLSLRRLIIKLDGPYKHKSGFSGPIEILQMIVNTLQFVHNWEPIEVEESIIELPDVVKNLSTDTKNC